MKVFITGATGYIGFNVAAAFRRAGHEVWGLIRDQEKAQALAKCEVRPVVGTMVQPEGYQAIIEECSVLIHAAADSRSDTFALDRQAVQALLSLSRLGPQPKMLIYTSGVWIYGHTGPQMADETTPLKPPKLVQARPAIEQIVLNEAAIRKLVIRPGCVYGKQGGMTGMWFKATGKKEILTAVGEGCNRWAMVHVDDLADGYVRAAESGLSGEIFNFTDGSQSTVGDMVAAVARASGYTGEIRFIPLTGAMQTMGDFADCLVLDQCIESTKALRLLGWHPRHSSFVDGVETYYASWKAYQSAVRRS
jgi:nucleoside-diphosphate-sugar epimerase